MEVVVLSIYSDWPQGLCSIRYQSFDNLPISKHVNKEEVTKDIISDNMSVRDIGTKSLTFCYKEIQMLLKFCLLE